MLEKALIRAAVIWKKFTEINRKYAHETKNKRSPFAMLFNLSIFTPQILKIDSLKDGSSGLLCITKSLHVKY